MLTTVTSLFSYSFIKEVGVITKTHAAVLQQVAQVIKHGLLVLTADPAEIAQKAAAVGHHLRKCDFLETKNADTT